MTRRTRGICLLQLIVPVLKNNQRIVSHFPSGNACARTREGTSSASMWTGTRVPRNTGFPPMILSINRSLVGARVVLGRRSGRAD